MFKRLYHNFALRLVRDGQIGAQTYNVIYAYLYGDKKKK